MYKMFNEWVVVINATYLIIIISLHEIDGITKKLIIEQLNDTYSIHFQIQETL